MMEMDSISPEEFRKLQIQVDILQRFLTKTFGSSFLEFCKETKLSITSGSGNAGITTSKPIPPLNKAQSLLAFKANGSASSSSNGNGTSVKVEGEIKASTNGSSQNSKKEFQPSTSSSANRRPPPLLHRPTGSPSKIGGTLTISAVNSRVANTSSKTASISATTTTAEEEQLEFYDEEDVSQFIQPETVFSDDEQSTSTGKKIKSAAASSSRNGSIKRDHSVAFGYEETDNTNNEDTMQLPEGTECIIIDDEDQGQQENYTFQQEDEMYEEGGEADTNDGEEYYDEEYSYSMVEDGLEVTANGNENYSTEELHTDGNVTFGTVFTAQDTGIQYFQCSFCPSSKVFKHKQSLKEHYLLNHSPTPPAYQCQCGRRFLKQSQLKRHEVVHTAERPYVCPICFKDFTRKDNMTVHMVRNHAEKKHPCPYCPDKVYATPAEVNRHLRMYHSQWQ